jgi:prepilin-type N-terminal cleavage/methylation domain-containing protein
MKKRAFTLIETLVVIAIIGLITPIVFTIIFIITREQTKISRLILVKRQGDNILNNISFTIKNYAYSIHLASPPNETNEVCNNLGSYSSSLIFKNNNDNSWFNFFLDNNIVSSYSSTLNSNLSLNTQSVLVDNFSISCQKKSLYSPSVVSLSFDICYKTRSNNCTSQSPEETALLHYQTNIKLRNY